MRPSESSSSGGAVSVTRRSVSVTAMASYTVLSDDYILDVTGTGSVLLPAVVDGRALRIKNAGSGVVTLDGSGAETIEGASTFPLGENSSVDLVATATAWLIH